MNVAPAHPGLKDLLTPILPKGVTYEDLYPPAVACSKNKTTWMGIDLTESAGPLDKLLTDLSAKRIKPKKDTVTEDSLATFLAKQAAIRNEYREKLDFLLALAEDRGAKARPDLLKNFRALIGDAYRESYLLGMKATSSGTKTPDKTMLARLAKEANDEVRYFDGFLKAIWGDEEVMPRDKRRDLYVNALDSLFSLGALTGTPYRIVIHWKISPAEHCIDCLRLAADSPYAKPGDRSVDLNSLPTVPRRGDTQCLGNCRCYLEYVKEDDPDFHYEPRPRVGVTIHKKDTDQEIDLDDDPDLEPVQKEADSLENDMAYYKAMFEATGDRKYLSLRRDANKRLIELQDESGVTFRPRMESDTMVKTMKAAQDEGFDPILPRETNKPTAGIEAGLIRGASFDRGRIESWNQDTGVGVFETLDGNRYPIASGDEHKSILAIPGAKGFLNKPWSIDEPDPSFTTFQVPGRQASYTELFDPQACDTEEAVGSPCAVLPSFIRSYSNIIRSSSPSVAIGFQAYVARGGQGGRGYRVVDGGAVFENMLTTSPKAAEPREVALMMSEAVGASFFRENDFTPGTLSEFMRLAADDFTSEFGLNLDDEESTFAAVYARYMTDRDAFTVDHPELAEALEDLIGSAV